MSPIRVALVNDYDVVVRGLAGMLSEFDDRIAFVDLNSDADVDADTDIALYDSFASPQPATPHAGSLSAHPLVRRSVLYTWDLAEAQIESVLRAGADGYISKSLPAAELVAAIEAIHAGTARAHRSPAPGVEDQGDWPGRAQGLTPREAEILALIAQGRSNEEIARHANISMNSVKTLIRSCYRRIGATRRPQAILWAVDHGFLPDRPHADIPRARQ